VDGVHAKTVWLAATEIHNAGAGPMDTASERSDEMSDGECIEDKQDGDYMDFTREQFRNLIGQVRANGSVPDEPLLAVYDELYAQLKQATADLKEALLCKNWGDIYAWHVKRNKLITDRDVTIARFHQIHDALVDVFEGQWSDDKHTLVLTETELMGLVRSVREICDCYQKRHLNIL